jgi:hypothetical protein
VPPLILLALIVALVSEPVTNEPEIEPPVAFITPVTVKLPLVSNVKLPPLTLLTENIFPLAAAVSIITPPAFR